MKIYKLLRALSELREQDEGETNIIMRKSLRVRCVTFVLPYYTGGVPPTEKYAQK